MIHQLPLVDVALNNGECVLVFVHQEDQLSTLDQILLENIAKLSVFFFMYCAATYRPGRRNAGSIALGRLVAATTTHRAADRIPSISVNNCATIRDS
jgi:hypothetical protein